MSILLLLLASVILVATMLFLTLCVNELEKKTLEVSSMLRKRYVIVIPEKGKDGKIKGGEPPGPAGRSPAKA